MVQLSVSSLNCRGLNKLTKRKNIFGLCQKYDISFLQETYITNKKYEIWKNDWPGNMFYFPGTNNSKGSITLINSKCDVSNCEVFFKNDRVLGLKCILNGEQYFLINIYGAANHEKREKLNFINDLYRVMSRLNSSNIIVGGDFNIVMDNDLDIISGNKHEANFVDSLKSWSFRMNLIDTWRSFNIDIKDFTWSRFSPFCARRLDYIFISSDLLPFVSNVQHTFIASSDHKLVSMDFIKDEAERGKGYWKFNNALLLEPTYLDFMNDKIDKFLNLPFENSILRFEYFKAMVKSETIIFSSNKKKQDDNKEIQLKYLIKNLNSEIISNPSNDKAIEKLMVAKKELEIFEINKSRGAIVRSKESEIEKGEKNTSYFLSLEKYRGSKNSIHRLSTEASEITTQEAILEALKEHFEALASKNHNLNDDFTGIQNFLGDADYNILKENDKNALEQPITKEEIGKGLLELNNDSTPGLDGITTSWYKVFYNKIKDILFNSYQESFGQSELGISQKLGVVSLLHKGKELSREHIKNWRPITITNTDYKILSKCLAKRMQSVLDELISPNQSGFMKGRNIADHIRLIDDAINLANKLDTPGLLVSLDFEKAFDSISKATILNALRVFNFGDKFINMVNTLTNNSESCILNFGWLSDFYDTTNTGIRQGCCLSPLLFILCAEIMGIKLRNDQRIKGLTFSKSDLTTEPLKILQYCDDTSLLLNSAEELDVALEIIDDFYKVSGLKLNKHKSIGMGIGSSKEIEGNPGNILWKQKGETIKILGIHFSSVKEASDLDENWGPKIKKVQEISCNLYKRKASLWGRILLCKTHLLSQLSYCIQALSIPDKFARQLDCILFQFIWKKHNNKKVIEKIKRDVMCMEKNRGGAGMIKVSTQQKVFLAKWLMKGDNRSSKSPVATSKISSLYLNHFGGIDVFYGYSCSGTDILFPSYFSRFWRDAIKTWLSLKSNIHIIHHQNSKILKNYYVCTTFLNCSLFYNNKLTIQGQTLFFKTWIEYGLYQIANVLESDGSFINWQKLPDGLTNRPEFLFEYNTLKIAVEKLRKVNNEFTISLNTEKMSCMGNQVFRNIFDMNYNQSICGAQFWKRKFDGIDIFDFYLSSLKTIKETKLQVFLFKIFHNIFPTKILLKKFNIVNNDKCECGQLDVVEHSLVECHLLASLWKEVNQSIVQVIGRSIPLQLSNKLFGIAPNNKMNLTKKQVCIVNNILIIAKFAIIKARAQNSNKYLMFYEEEYKARSSY